MVQVNNDQELTTLIVNAADAAKIYNGVFNQSVHMSSESDSEDPFAGYDSDKDKEYFPSESDRLVLQIPRTSYGIHNTIGNSNKDVCGLPPNNSIQSVIPVEIEHYRITDSNDIERVQVEAECEFDKKVQKRRSRKRERNPSAWVVNVRKEKRNRGESYVSSRNKLMPARSIQNLKDCTAVLGAEAYWLVQHLLAVTKAV
nr:unnamed protein product [Callosobruchus chinensis]